MSGIWRRLGKGMLAVAAAAAVAAAPAVFAREAQAAAILPENSSVRSYFPAAGLMIKICFIQGTFSFLSRLNP